MTDRVVRVRVEADVAKAKKALEDLGYTVEGTSESLEESSSAWEKIGDKAAIAGASGAAGLGLATKAAIDWETAWAGVTKTVNGTDEEMAQLETGLRKLATDTLPASHEEIAGVAEAAGQLGVKQKDILDFTKTMIDLGESTNLTADEAATSIAQIANVMGTLDRDGAEGVRRFSSTLVQLGNNGASTEKDIVEMAARLAGAAKIVGATESDLLAMANAMASVGIEAQLGGGVMSRVMLQINSAVKEGGDGLDAFAETAGVSAKEFSTKFKTDPVAAIDLFIKGLSRINAEGGDAAGTLSDLGLKGTENASVLLRLAGSGDLLSESLSMGNKAWKDNNALTAEAEKRYATTASRLEIARNSINDAAIDIGGNFLPALVGASETVAGLAKSFGDLDPDMQSTIVRIAATVTGLTLLAAGGIKAVAGIKAVDAALKGIGITSGLTAKGVGVAVAALAALAAAGAAFRATQDDQSLGTQQLTRDLLSNSNAVDLLDKRFGELDASASALSSTSVPDLGAALDDVLGGQFLNNTEKVLGGVLNAVSLGMIDIQSNLEVAEKRLGDVDSALAQLASSGNADEAARAFEQISEQAKSQGLSIDELKTKFPQYAEALAAIENQQSQTTGTTSALTAESEAANAAFEEAALSTQDWADALNNMNQPQLDAREAARQVTQSVIDFNKALDDNGTALNKNRTGFATNTQAGLDNEAALDNVASAYNRQLEAMAAAGSSQTELDKKLRGSRAELEKVATSAGLTKEAARLYVEQVLRIPVAKATTITVDTAKATTDLKALQARINGLRGNDVRITTRYVDIGKNPSSKAGGITKADGGLITGPGTGTSDSIQARLSNGEYVIRAAAVSHYGPDVFDRLNSMAFAEGGYVGSMSSAPAATGGFSGGPSKTYSPTFQVYGNDAYQAAERAMREFEYRVVSEL